MTQKKQITFLSYKIPYPPDKDGNNINVFNIIKALSQRKTYTIRFILHSNTYNQKDLVSFQEYVDEVIIKKPLNQYSFFWKVPFMSKTKVDGSLFFCNYDSGIYTSLYQSENKILYSADSPTFHHSKIASLKSKLLYLKHYFQERYLFSKFRYVVFVGTNDLQYSKTRIKGTGLVIPIGYDASFESPDIFNRRDKQYDFAFSGNFAYLPNRMAAEKFLENNVPIILKEIPQATFYFVGRHPSEKMMTLASSLKKNVIISGEVKNVEVELLKARIYFSNLSNGSGMKNKILQAMICRLPIVCSPESWSGFPENQPKGVWIKENETDFNETLISLHKLKSTELRLLGDENNTYYLERYTWSKIIENHYLPVFES